MAVPFADVAIALYEVIEDFQKQTQIITFERNLKIGLWHLERKNVKQK